MPPYTTTTILAALAGAAGVSAHGYVNQIIIDGQQYVGYNPTIAPWQAEHDSIGWQNWATDTGFVPSSSMQDPDIIYHLDAKNAPLTATSHHGPVVDYLANCHGDCTTVDKTLLKFFKIAEMGQLELGPGGGATGYWASDKFIGDGAAWKVTIPDSIAPGSYVLRHEQIALHHCYAEGLTQMYPQCINLVITGGGSDNPEGVLGTELYSSDDPGIFYNIYNDETNPVYQIPGPE
ncbi:Endoglucanase-like protein [Emericellopsis cladophorae]|uniref:lytic cellulose monooxygenase (C4-dehydrogenating) n=1 Tax=Emericellopsis cladophorae TaxID=2686198 RepID=A0A9P9Y131_9HYPO|nr:Endoglucanase-like protein [Emericellopsis cladophorae]KAI6781633.1 Endoglucanase-like protein [Emericellopsis cladophorae]